jgi:hypothetical protein
MNKANGIKWVINGMHLVLGYYESEDGEPTMFTIRRRDVDRLSESLRTPAERAERKARHKLASAANRKFKRDRARKLAA